MQPLIDPFGRRVKDLRISITDRCNFRCTYCMPEEGMDWLRPRRAAHLRGEARIARVCVERFGFDGDPDHRRRAHRPGAPAPAGRACSRPLGVDIAHDHQRREAARAGPRPRRRRACTRVNVSLDTLRPETFRALTRRDELDRVLAGIDAALDAGLDPVKVNAS